VIITQTPLRVSFVGGGTDIADFYKHNGGGCVLSTAIDKYVFVIVKERFDDKIYINYSRKEIVDSVDEIQHDLVREAMRLTGVERGVEITTLADVPSEGSGLGSSSSITVGLLNAFHTYMGRLVTAEQLAQEACRIEIDILQRPIGKQDQYIAAYGNMRMIEFNPDETVTVSQIEVSDERKRELDSRLMLFFTGITRSSSSILSHQKQHMKARSETLKRMRQQAYEMREIILNGDLDEVGYLLHRAWEAKRSLSDRISSPQIDEFYNAAIEAGALGGKICGAGGGGFLLLYCPPECQDDVRRRLAHLRELPFHLERDGSKVIFNIRR